MHYMCLYPWFISSHLFYNHLLLLVEAGQSDKHWNLTGLVSILVKMESKCHFSFLFFFIFTDSSSDIFPLLFLFSDFAGFVQFISHRSCYLPIGGSLLPHTLLLLSPWWPEWRIRRRGGGWGWQHGSRLQWEEGAGNLLCHVGGGGGCHALLVRKSF